MYVDETNAERRKRWATKDSEYYYYPQDREVLLGPLHGPWPKPDPATEAALNSILTELFADMPGDEP